MRPSRPALAIAAALAMPACALAEEPALCDDREAVVAGLQAEGKLPLFVASGPNGVLTELHLAVDGSWAVVQTYTGDLVCKVADGDMFEFVFPVVVLRPERGS